MSRKTLMIWCLGLVIISFTSIYGYNDCVAGCGGRHGVATCPRCNTICTLKVEGDKEDKHCWNVECKEICIPKVVFPWQKDCCNPCLNNGARVRTVKVLKKHACECPTCQYTWTPKKICHCGNGCGAACSTGRFDAGLPHESREPSEAAAESLDWEAPNEVVATPPVPSALRTGSPATGSIKSILKNQRSSTHILQAAFRPWTE